MKLFWVFVFLGVSTSANPLGPRDTFNLTVIHINDWHSRYEETSDTSGPCKDSTRCIGGFSRMYRELQSHRDRPNVLYLNAGDNYQGTLWFNVYGWNVTQYFLNKLPCDAYTIGNHEFDKRVAGLVPFLKAVKAPHVVANIDASQHPEMNGTFKKSIIVNKGGKKIGIIGVITETTPELSHTEKIIFLEPLKEINKEAEKISQECDIIIVLSHCGIKVDLELAKKVGPKVNLIVGGHSHTVLYNGEAPSVEPAAGPYPMVVDREDGRKVLVVQAGSYSRYVGDITVSYDEKGNVINWQGQPIYLSTDKPTDEQIDKELAPWKDAIDEYGKRVLGYSDVILDTKNCHGGECNIGDFIADAMVDYYTDKAEPGTWTYASVAFINSGGIRTTIKVGNITYDDLATCLPFESTTDVGELTGAEIKSILEYSVTESKKRIYTDYFHFIQVSGLRFVVDLKKPTGSRVSDLKILCQKCSAPLFEDIKLDELYRVTTTSFLTGGGDGYSTFKNLRNLKRGDLDTQVVERYIKKKTPIKQQTDGRILVLEKIIPKI